MPLEIHLVAHTHWDREWYQTAEVFRQRLVDLVDELIDAPPRAGESFLLDGQAIVLEDYLEVRPDRRDRVRSLLDSGRIEAGPWYVLADELIPGGEALVRNLQAGRRILDRLGAKSPPVLYCPDSFGHPASLPDIATGFGLPLVVLWRGYGGRRWPSGDVVRWRGPSGAETLVFHLPPDGYEFGSSLPSTAEAAASRWERIRATLAPRSTVGVTLLQNGADHHARQSRRDESVRLLQEVAEKGGDRVKSSSIRGFAEAIIQRAPAQRLPTVSGELRDSYGYTWTLQGTFGTRAAQKRANAIAERSLVRRAEPWSGLAWLSGAPSQAHHLESAWKSLLSAHPHDTLCGTSIDDVAAAMDLRICSAMNQADSITVAAVNRLLAYDLSAVRDQGDPGPDAFVIRNDVPWARGGVVLIDVVERLVDEPVGPGSGNGPRFEAIRDLAAADYAAPKGTQRIQSRITRHRIESPRHYPDNDIVRITTLACATDTVPAMSLTPFDLSSGAAAPGGRVRVSGDEMSNTMACVGFQKAGSLGISRGDRTAPDLVSFEDLADHGDLYTPSLDKPLSAPRLAKLRVVHKGPHLGEVHQQWTFAAPGEKRGASHGTLGLSVRLIAESPLVEIAVRGENHARNHRLRIGFATGVANATVVADAAFGPVERSPTIIDDKDATMEQAPATAPLHRYVSLFAGPIGATVYSDGLAEYEVDQTGVIWITLVRAVGELSRNDLPERPGHAGWPEDTPQAQSIGPFEARFAVLLHGGRTPAIIDEIERESDRFLNPLHGFTVRATVDAPQAVAGPELAGVGLAFSALKQSEDGEWLVLRCVNLVDREQTGTWTFPRPVTVAKLARLDETPTGDLAVVMADGRSRIEFVAGPRAIVTILVR